MGYIKIVSKYANTQNCFSSLWHDFCKIKSTNISSANTFFFYLIQIEYLLFFTRLSMQVIN